MKKILVTGSTGMLGRTVVRFFKEKGYSVSSLDRQDLDLSTCSFLELKGRVLEQDYDILINCAGLISQRKDIPLEDFMKVNCIIPRWLANICEENNIMMFHPTTDCIYDGSKGPYLEGTKREVQDDYGLSKALGEPENCCVIRSSIIGEEESNKLSLLEWVRSNKGKSINGFTNHLWNGVTCLEMSKIISEILETGLYYKGTKHYFSPTVSKAELVEYINKVYELDINISNISTGTIIDKTLSSLYTKQRKGLEQQIVEQKLFWNGE